LTLDLLTMLHKETNSILPAAFDLLVKLQADSQFKDFFLVGETALALRLGHRLSVDIDLFTVNDFDVNALSDYLVEAYGLQTATIQKNTLMGFIEGIKVDFIAHKYRLLYPLFQEESVTMAELLDIAAMKLNAIGYSGHRYKDFIDIYFLLKLFPLKKMVDAFSEKYPNSNPVIAVRGLGYFNDIDEKADSPILVKPIKRSEVEIRLVQAIHDPTRIFST
jgi:hypothetical protein